MSRHKKLFYQGTQVPVVVADDGTVVEYGPDRSFPGIPARDLDEEDIKRLTPEEYADATGGKQPLYTPEKRPGKSTGEAKDGGEKKAAAPPRKRPSRAKKVTPKDQNATAVSTTDDLPAMDTALIEPGTDLSKAVITENPKE